MGGASLAERPGQALRVRVVGTLFLVGALLGALSLLLPHQKQGDVVIWGIVGFATLAGIGLLLAHRQIPGSVTHAAIAIASALVNLAILASGIPAGLYEVMFFWVAIFSAYFFTPRAVAAHLAWLLACFAVTLALLEGSTIYSDLTRWTVTAVALAVAASLTSWLVQTRERAERRGRRFFDLPLDLLCTAREDGYFASVNASWERTLGYTQAEICARPFIEFVHPEDRARTVDAVERIFAGHDVVNFENRYRARDGSFHWLQWRAALAPEDGLIYARAVDITERKRLDMERDELIGEVEAQARTDPLTGLPNRRWLAEELKREIARADRHGSPLCVAVADLDRFKIFNDRYGHPEGDALLVEATSAWRAALRTNDFLARIGGEEFVVLLPDCDVEDATAVIDRLRAATPRAQQSSAGIARWIEGESGEAVIRRADKALYTAKAHGRNRTVVHGDTLLEPMT